MVEGDFNQMYMYMCREDFPAFKTVLTFALLNSCVLVAFRI